MAMAHVGIQACVLIATLLCAGSARSEESNDLRDLRVGMPIAEIPAEEYVDLTCAVAPENRLDRWAEYPKCPTDGAGIRGVAFHFNEGLNPLAQVNETYEGTKIAGHPVLLTLLIDNRGIVDGLRIDTDPKARLFWRKKAHPWLLPISSLREDKRLSVVSASTVVKRRLLKWTSRENRMWRDSSE